MTNTATSKFGTWKQWKRDALRMHYQGKSHQEIADALGKPYFTITSHLHRHRGTYPKEYVMTYFADYATNHPSSPPQLLGSLPTKAVEFKPKRKPTIFVIGDLQVKQGISLDYIHHVGAYIAKKQPDIIVQIGDWFDNAALSSYDRGQLSA